MAVVRGEVPDYAVVIGNPAVVRMRFSAAEIAELNRIAWWTWPKSLIATHVAAIMAGDVATLAQVLGAER